jgi:hypothetical protein
MGSASAWARFLIIFANDAHRQFSMANLLCLHLRIHPLEQNLLLTRDAIIIRPVVEVETMREEGGVRTCNKN